MIKIYEKLSANIWPMIFRISSYEKQSDIKQFSDILQDLEPGDVVMRKSRFPSQLQAFFGDIDERYSHAAIYLGDGLIFDYSFPAAKILPLEKMLSLATSVSVVKLKKRKQGLKKELIKFAKERGGAPFHPLNLAFVPYCTLLREFIKLSVDKREKEKIWDQTLAMLEYGAPFLICTSSILQPWFEFLPQIKHAFFRTQKDQNFNSYPLSPDQFMVFIASHPQLFSIRNFNSEEKKRTWKHGTRSFPDHQAYQNLTHSRKFLLHARIMIAYQGYASIISHSSRISPRIRKKYAKLNGMVNILSTLSINHAINPSQANAAKLFSLISIMLESLELGARPYTDQSITLKQIREELKKVASPKL